MDLSRQRRFGGTPLLALVVGIASLAFVGYDGASVRDQASAAPAASARPRNVIVMISDGCGYNQVDAASLYQYGETGKQAYERFPVRLAMSTYSRRGSYDPAQFWASRDGMFRSAATDSAAAATALATGVKTYNGAIGMEGANAAEAKPVKNVIERAEELGKSTGVVTSVTFNHATPASFVAHEAGRGSYEEIARQMIMNSAVDVIMGCGHPNYSNSGRTMTTPIYKNVGGEATWDALKKGTAGADANGDGTPDPWTLIETREQFRALASGTTPGRVCGVAQASGTLQQGRSGSPRTDAPYATPFNETVPTIAEMTTAALNVLGKNPKGFLLMVESGGAVDWACHSAQPGRLIEEQVAHNQAVEAAIAWVEKNSNWQETLLIVTGDHETGGLWGPGTGEPDPDGKPVVVELKSKGAKQVPDMQFCTYNEEKRSGSHTNALLPLYAKGAGSDGFLRFVQGTDPRRGRYVDNTSVANLVFELFGGRGK